MTNSDLAKVVLLCSLYLFCVLTSLTSSSFQTGENGVGRLKPPPGLCQKPRTNHQRLCAGSTTGKDVETKTSSNENGDSDVDCRELKREVESCERTLERAYRHVNMRGCARKIQKVAVCTEMNCPTRALCKETCKKENKELATCSLRVVQDFFNKYGHDFAGTAKG